MKERRVHTPTHTQPSPSLPPLPHKASITPCCLGCKASLNATNLHPRLACVLAACAVAAALVPWGFGASLRQLDATVAGAGGRLQAAALALAVWLAAGCVAVSCHCVAAAAVGVARACGGDAGGAPRGAGAWPVKVVAGASKWSGWK